MLVPSPEGLAPPPTVNPGSAPACSMYLITILSGYYVDTTPINIHKPI